jgi:hypothetical protein
MSTTRNGVTSRPARGAEEDIAKGEVIKTLLSNWDRRLEMRKVKVKPNRSTTKELKTRKQQRRGYKQGKIDKIQLSY